VTVELQPVGPGRGHGPRAAIAVAVLGLTVVAAAVLTRVDEPMHAEPEPTRFAEALPVAPSPTPATDPTPTPRPLPGVVRCVDVRVPDCLTAVEMALGLLGDRDPHVREATARTRIVCGDTFDCPPDRLRRMVRPIATVTLRFDDGAGSAWVNVIEQQRGRPLDAPPRLQAWLVRWVVGTSSATD
jgi:hypothetical protein